MDMRANYDLIICSRLLFLSRVTNELMVNKFFNQIVKSSESTS